MTKFDIQKILSTDINISISDSLIFIDSFISLIKKNSIKTQQKISKFGTFRAHKTKARIGRNPKTREEHRIKSSVKVVFKASKNIKDTLN